MKGAAITVWVPFDLRLPEGRPQVRVLQELEGAVRDAVFSKEGILPHRIIVRGAVVEIDEETGVTQV